MIRQTFLRSTLLCRLRSYRIQLRWVDGWPSSLLNSSFGIGNHSTHYFGSFVGPSDYSASLPSSDTNKTINVNSTSQPASSNKNILKALESLQSGRNKQQTSINPKQLLQQIDKEPIEAFQTLSKQNILHFFECFDYYKFKVYENPILKDIIFKFFKQMQFLSRQDGALSNKEMVNLFNLCGSLGLNWKEFNEEDKKVYLAIMRSIMNDHPKKQQSTEMMTKSFPLYCQFFNGLGRMAFDWTVLSEQEQQKLLSNIPTSRNNPNQEDLLLFMRGLTELRIQPTYFTPRSLKYYTSLLLNALEETNPNLNSSAILYYLLTQLIATKSIPKQLSRSQVQSIFDGLKNEFYFYDSYKMCQTIYNLGELQINYKFIPPNTWGMINEKLIERLHTDEHLSLKDISKLVQGLKFMNHEWEDLSPPLQEGLLQAIERIIKSIEQQKRNDYLSAMTNIISFLSRLGAERVWNDLSKTVQGHFYNLHLYHMEKEIPFKLVSDYLLGMATMKIKWNSMEQWNQANWMTLVTKELSEEKIIFGSELAQLLQAWHQLECPWIENQALQEKIFMQLNLMYEKTASLRHRQEQRSQQLKQQSDEPTGSDLKLLPRILYLLGKGDCVWELIPSNTKDALLYGIELYCTKSYLVNGKGLSQILTGLVDGNAVASTFPKSMTVNLQTAIASTADSITYGQDSATIIYGLAMIHYKWTDLPESIHSAFSTMIKQTIHTFKRSELVNTMYGLMLLSFDCMDKQSPSTFLQLHQPLVQKFFSINNNKSSGGINQFEQTEKIQLFLYLEWLHTLPSKVYLTPLLKALHYDYLPLYQFQDDIRAPTESQMKLFIQFKKEFKDYYCYQEGKKTFIKKIGKQRLEKLEFIEQYHGLQSKLYPMPLAIKYNGEIIAFVQLSFYKSRPNDSAAKQQRDRDSEGVISRTDELREYFYLLYHPSAPIWRIDRLNINNEEGIVEVSKALVGNLVHLLDEIDAGRSSN